jgi:hypothetical protein
MVKENLTAGLYGGRSSQKAKPGYDTFFLSISSMNYFFQLIPTSYYECIKEIIQQFIRALRIR